MPLNISIHEVIIYPIVPGKSPECLDSLSITERKAAKHKLRAVDRAAYVACRTLLRKLLARYLDCTPAHVPITLTANGQPGVEDCDLSLSISHTRGLSLVATTRNRRLGIDLERLDRKADFELLAQTYLSRSRKKAVLKASGKYEATSFLKDWTRHEALVKATGLGLVFPADETIPDLKGLSVILIEGPPEYVIAVAADGSDWHVKWGDTDAL